MVVQNLTKRRKVPDTKGMDVTSVEGLVGAKVGLSPEDVLKQRAFYASVRETIVRVYIRHIQLVCVSVLFRPTDLSPAGSGAVLVVILAGGEILQAQDKRGVLCR